MDGSFLLATYSPTLSGTLAAPTQGEWRNARLGKPSLGLAAETQRLAEENNFFHWPLEFPDVFDQGGFDCVLGNPPWERIKLQEEEFFAQRDPEIAAAPNKAARQKLINALIISNPALARSFDNAKHAAECSSKFMRRSNRFLLTAVGDVNTYALFAEHFRDLISVRGCSGIIVPTGIATDETTKRFFGELVKNSAITALYDFENREKLFPSVDSRMKFCILALSGLPVAKSEFVFFITRADHLRDPWRRFSLTPQEIAVFNPNSHTMPVFRTQVDAEITRKIYNFVPILQAKNGDNPWQLYFTTMFHMANDSGRFFAEFSQGLLPLFESKMFQAYDHRAASVVYVPDNAIRQNQPIGTTLDQYLNPNHFPTPLWWISTDDVSERLRNWDYRWLVAFKDITSATNERTAIFTFLPFAGVGHTAPLVIFGKAITPKYISAFVANANCLVFDYITRQKLGGLHLSYSILHQLPVLSPQEYNPTHIEYIAPRVLELVYTAYDLKPFAEDMGYYGEPFIWHEERRALLRAELDAYYAKLYGLTRDELRYILDPQDVYGPDFPGETFRVLKEREIRQLGEYRTRRLVLEAWDRLEGVEPAVIERPVVPEQPAPVEEFYAPPVKEKPAAGGQGKDSAGDTWAAHVQRFRVV